MTGQPVEEWQLDQVLRAEDSQVFLQAAVAYQGQAQGQAALDGALLEIEERQTAVQGLTTQMMVVYRTQYNAMLLLLAASLFCGALSPACTLQ